MWLNNGGEDAYFLYTSERAELFYNYNWSFLLLYLFLILARSFQAARGLRPVMMIRSFT
jgi:hypothetical protein